MKELISDLATVKLTKAFTTPYDNAVATARTCYSSRIIQDEDVSRDDKAKKLRDKIASSTYMAGHHTTLQHAHFQFAIKNISRQSLWGFFHAHPFYNSEQVSQRYVPVKSGNFIIPKLKNERCTNIYINCIKRQQVAYNQLVELLIPVCEEKYFSIYKGRKKNATDKRWQRAIKKRALEVARYVLPLGMFAHLYHTISGLTLHRYHRIANSLDCPLEQKIIIDGMVNEVKKMDPQFFKNIEDTIDLKDTLEAQAFERLQASAIDSKNASRFAKSFDEMLSNKTSHLISHTQNPSEALAQAVRQSLFVTKETLPTNKAVELALSPNFNSYLGESLNLSTLSKINRALSQIHFSFNKKMSHSADSQAQRHRTLPGVKPIFSRTINLEEPDFITPEIFLDKKAKAAKDVYDKVHEETLKDINTLYKEGVSAESLQYLFTNAYPIRYCDTGSLMDHVHKWTIRLCYNAQEEIWRSAKDEVLQVKSCDSTIGKYLLPPCGLRKISGHTPLCPEGDRFCGVAVWKQEVKDYKRLL